MLAYAAANDRPAGRAGSPRALVLIVAGHVLAIGAVMTAKMELSDPNSTIRTILVDIPADPPPPKPPEPTTDIPRSSSPSTVDRPTTAVDIPALPSIPLDPGPPTVDLGPTIIDTGPAIGAIDPPRADPVRVGPRFATPDHALKPPYPASKLRAEEEATLRLRLVIDVRGRVTSVEAAGPADPEFLLAARRHILRAWKYKPATEDGVAIPSSTVITLSFRLEDA